VTLTPHPLIVPWSWKDRPIPLLPLWALRHVQSLSACTMGVYYYTVTGTVVRFYMLSKHVNSITTCWNINYSTITISEVYTCSGTRESDLPHKASQDERGSLPGRCRNLVDSPPRPYRLRRWLLRAALPSTVGKGAKQSLRSQFASSGMRGASAAYLRGEAFIQRSSFHFNQCFTTIFKF
jgi:hypothetical protein